MRTLLRAVAIVTLAAIAVACGGDDTVASGGGPGYDGDYLATEVVEDGAPHALVEGTSLSLRLSDGKLTASAGCNTIGGDATIEGDVLRVAALSMTEMGCDAPRHAQDEWLAAVLSDESTLTASDDGIVLRTDRIAITFVDRSVAEPDLPLVGTVWVVDGYVDGTGPDGTASSAVGDQARVTFDANGFVTGDDGCNGFGYGGPAGGAPTDGLRYEVDGDRITFSGAAVSTLIACPDVDTERFTAVLSGTVTWKIDGSTLTLLAEDGHGVTYRAQP